MSSHISRRLLVLATFLGGLACTLAIVFLVAKPQGGSHATSAVAGIGGPFQLVDQNGKTVTDVDLKGGPFLVFFGFTHCPDICPTSLQDLSDVLDKLGNDAAKLHVVFITVDPERDTPQALKDYLASFDPRIVGLTGDRAAITAVAKGYRVYLNKVPLEGSEYTVDHSAVVYLMDRDGRFVAPFNLKRRPEDAAADLRRYL